MTKAIAALRIFLALDLLLNGINFWFHFIPITTPASVEARALMGGLVQAGLFSIVKYVEVGTGLLLLANRYVPLALIVMFPLTVVIFWTDCILIATPEGYLFGGTTALVHCLLMVAYLNHFMGLFVQRAIPGTPSPTRIGARLADAVPRAGP